MRDARYLQAFASALAIGFFCSPSLAQDAVPEEFMLDFWLAELGISQDSVREIGLTTGFEESGEVSLPGEVTSAPVDGFSVSANLQLDNRYNSLVRVILVADDGTEYLVYEATPLTLGEGGHTIDRACEETCALVGITPQLLRVELADAAIRFSSVAVVQDAGEEQQARSRVLSVQSQEIPTASSSTDESIAERQLAAKVDRLNQGIQAQGLRWVAGATGIARMSFEERKTLLARDGEMPNLQGFEYYVGGVFEVRTGAPITSQAQPESLYVERFDWRNRHGAADPASPYYDGDPDGGGWLTSVKGQKCGDCWAHSALGTVEAQANLYYNQHVDLDLAEQELVSCSSAGGCSGGNPGAALRYVESNGISEEACFPSSGTNEPCSNFCPNPEERIMISDSFSVPRSSEDSLKQRILRNGPIAFGISSWGHCMVAAGFTSDLIDGGTIWILKNSWGTSWGENGYGYVRVPLNDYVYLTYAISGPVISLLKPREVACYDMDGDGLENCGISTLNTGDCDDWDPTVQLFSDDGRCLPAPVLLNDYVSFRPDPSSFSYSSRTAGCQSGAVGTFRFEARLTNTSSRTLDDLSVEILRLTRKARVLVDDRLYRQGDSVNVPFAGDYADGRLKTEESVDMPFAVCLKSRAPFSLRVDVNGSFSQDTDPDEGLIGYYAFEGDTRDSSGNGNHGVNYGAIPAKGMIGAAYEFDGAGSYIDTPLNINPDAAPAVTMMAWVYPNRTGGTDVYRGRRQILSSDDNRAPGFDRSLLMEYGSWAVFHGGSYWNTGVPADVRTWQHVAVVIEPTGVRFYKNGVEYRRSTTTGTYRSSNTLRVGANPGGWREFFDGVIDEVRVYDRALSAAEIGERFASDRRDR